MIRDAELGDAPDLARVHVASWQRAYVGLIDQSFLDAMSVESRIERWNHVLGQDRTRVLVAEAGGSVVGFCSLGPADQGGWGEIYAIYVDPEHWGEGLGRALLAAGELALSTAGHRRAVLWVLEGNLRARVFYERQGWVSAKPIRLENIGGSQVTEIRYEKHLGPR
ncbi:MAG TPA: GNAT family N-acetyltransferase [Acidimicrobiia bacterium]|nr:GNAT family N-acetyltransferase [Acidimicrobiia bacterium]